MHKKWIIIPVAAAAVGLGGFSLAGSASAHGMWGGGANNDPMVSRLAKAFGKSEDEVRTVFEQMRSEHEAERLADLTAKLDAGVSAGQITNDQKQLLLAKFTAPKAEHEASHQLGQASGEKPARKDRIDKHQARKAELKAWATEYGISTEFLSTLFERPPQQQP